MSTASPIKTNEQVRLNPIVFFGSTALILVLTAALILYPDSAGSGEEVEESRAWKFGEKHREERLANTVLRQPHAVAAWGLDIASAKLSACYAHRRWKLLYAHSARRVNREVRYECDQNWPHPCAMECDQH